jgi:REP element-mobilizing transposase RayT
MSRLPRIPNWLPWEQSTIYFITFCVEHRKPVLANPYVWKTCRVSFDKLDQWIVLAAIVMPDHLHLLAAPVADRGASVSAFAKWFKRWFNEAYWNGGPSASNRGSNCRPSVSDGDQMPWRWQEGCFDRLLRSDESLSDKWEYLRQNPVRAGLVEHPDDWPYQFQFNT